MPVAAPPIYNQGTGQQAAAQGNPAAGALGPAGPQGPQLQSSLVPGAPGHAVLGSNPDQVLPPPPPTPTYTPPPAPSLDFMTPAMQQYVNQFKQSQTQQQQAMNAGLVQALQGLGQRRDAAAKVAATLPGEFDKQYAEATKSQHQATADSASAFAGPTLAGNADQPLISASNAAQQATGKGAQPLLEAGITADYSKGATTLSNTDMANKAALAQAQQQFDQQMLQSQAQYQQGIQAQQSGYAHDEAMARLNSSLGVAAYKAENPNKSLSPQDQIKYANLAAQDSQAIKNGFQNYAQQKAYENLPAYHQVVDVLSGKSGVKIGDKNIQPGDKSIIKYITDPYILKALVANGIVSAAEMQALYGQV